MMVGIFHFHDMNSEPRTSPPRSPPQNSTADSSKLSLFECWCGREEISLEVEERFGSQWFC